MTKKTQDRNDEVEKNNEEAKETVENKNDNENGSGRENKEKGENSSKYDEKEDGAFSMLDALLNEKDAKNNTEKNKASFMTAALKIKLLTIKSQSDQTLDMKPRVVSSQKLENLQRTSKQANKQTNREFKT